jgi:(S)-ureidoglycine aminohydrolase
MGHNASFAQYLIYLEKGGGSDEPEPEQGVESFLFMLGGRAQLTIAGESYALAEGGFGYVPPDVRWSIRSNGSEGAKFLWLRKVYEPYGGPPPKPLVGNERDVEPIRRTPTKTITTLIPTNDIAYDFHINIGNLEPGASISTEAHIMEHFEYFLQGKGLYLLNDRWHEVQAGDFIWMRAFCPQAFYPTGPALTRSIFYKNMNRQIMLRNSK